jgi:hypothetical protein
MYIQIYPISALPSSMVPLGNKLRPVRTCIRGMLMLKLKLPYHAAAAASNRKRMIFLF